MIRVSLTNGPDVYERAVETEGGSFAISLRRPTLIQRHQLEALDYRTRGEERLKAAAALIVGWRDVVDEAGAQVPFSAQSFERLLGGNGRLYWDVLNTVEKFLAENHSVLALAEDAEKNSSAPPATPSSPASPAIGT